MKQVYQGFPMLLPKKIALLSNVAYIKTVTLLFYEVTHGTLAGMELVSGYPQVPMEEH